MPIRSSAGGLLDLPVPKPGQVDIKDVARGLAKQCRFHGQMEGWFSVAQHSVEVAVLCQTEAKDRGLSPRAQAEAGMAGLLHDAHEAYVGDQVTPQKRRLGQAWKDLEEEVDGVVLDALGYRNLLVRHGSLVRWADREMFVSDKVRWGVLGTLELPDGSTILLSGRNVPPPYKLRFPNAVQMNWTVAQNMFLKMYGVLRASLDDSRADASLEMPS